MENTSHINLKSDVLAQPKILRGQPVYTLYETLVSELNRRGASELTTLFAEPVEGTGADHVDWYGPPSDGSAQPWSDLDDEQQKLIAEKLTESVSKLRSLADGSDENFDKLLASIQLIPSINDIVALNGSPLLVRWGMLPNTSLSNAAIIDDLLIENRTPPVLPHEPRARQRKSYLTPFLSVALTLLLLTISGVLTLRNCGLAWPRFLTNGELVHIMNFCPQIDALYAPEAEYIGRLEQDLALQVAECPVQPLPERVVPEEVITERVDNSGVKTGQLAITLAWNSTADLDLHVLCPTGERISHKKPKQCKGSLQLDMNHGKNRSETPIESIFWPADNIPRGEYQVHVACFSPNDKCSDGVPYTVDVRDQNGQSVSTFEGVANAQAKTQLLDSDQTLAGIFEQP